MISIISDGTTIEINYTLSQLYTALKAYDREKERLRSKAKRQYVSTGNPKGRPKRSPTEPKDLS